VGEVAYTVRVSFTDRCLADAWLRWLRGGHVAEVLASGATSAEVIALDGPDVVGDVRDRFPSREAFERYEREHAPRLRAEGLRLFPVEKGVGYCRSVGAVLDRFPTGP
jgi:hypothetical protein